MEQVRYYDILRLMNNTEVNMETAVLLNDALQPGGCGLQKVLPQRQPKGPGLL